MAGWCPFRHETLVPIPAYRERIDEWTTQTIRISLTGRLRLELGSNVVDASSLGPLGTVALAFLVIERQGPVTRHALAEVLWGEQLPATWEPSLRSLISRVRRRLADARLSGDVISGGAGCYQLHLPAGTVVDIEEAAASLRDASDAQSRGDWDRASRLAHAAADVASRPFVAGLSGLWVEQRQAELAELRLQALEVLADAASKQGDHATATAAAEAAVAAQPLRESAFLRLMAAQAAAGHRGEALRSYERCRRTLAEELGVSPSEETEAAYLALLEVRADPIAGPPTNLPVELSSFVGRSDELGDLEKMLTSTRLLTLVGPGGVGKTRLASRVAARLAGHHRHGVWLVELAALTDAATLVSHVRSILGLGEEAGVPPPQSLRRQLGERDMLLVLDNCEHLSAACAALVRDLLSGGTGLRVLATSREPLGIPGESLWPVPALSLPRTEHVDPGRLWEAESVRLFVERATAAEPSFEFSPDNASAVAEICRRLDGLPLAIELAAARVRSTSVGEIAVRLEDRFGLLVGRDPTAPGRHRTLRAAVAWSHDALLPREQVLFRRVSVFSGGFTAEAAERVCSPRCSDQLDVFEGLTDLVGKSLIVADRTGPITRYGLLETLRQYGAERLAAAGEEVTFRNTHLQWCVLLAERADAEIRGPSVRHWLAVLDEEHGNMQAALRWAEVAGRSEPGLRLGAALRLYWEMRGRIGEGRDWLDRLLTREGGVDPLVRARALAESSVLAFCQDDATSAERLSRESLILAAASGSQAEVARAYIAAGGAAVLCLDFTAARLAYQYALDAARAADDRFFMAMALVNLGYVSMSEGNPEAARPFLEASLAIRRELGNPAFVGRTLSFLGMAAHQEHHLDEAKAILEESVSTLRDVGDGRGLLQALLRYGDVQRTARAFQSACQLYLEAAAIEVRMGSLRGLSETLVSGAKAAFEAGDSRLGGHLLGTIDRLLFGDGGAPPQGKSDLSAAYIAVLQEEIREWLERLRAQFGGTAVDRAFEEAASMGVEDAVMFAQDSLGGRKDDH